MTNVARLDAGTIDRLLSGRMEPDDAPPRLATVAELARALAAPPTSTELRSEEAAVVAASAILTMPERALHRADRSGTATSPTRGRFRRTKVTSLVFAGTLLATTGLAAAGVLPDPVQDVAHRILSTVGIDVPGSDDDRPVDPSGDERSPAGADVDDQNAEEPDEAAVPPEDVAGDESDEPHGQSDEPHGQSDEPHGQSDEPHGQSDEPHGQSDEPHGQGDEPHGKGIGNGDG